MNIKPLKSHTLPLNEEVMLEMKRSRIKKHDYSMIWMHWFNAVSWLGLLITGAALINSTNYQFIPEPFQLIVSSIFDGRENLLRFHIWLGVLWTFVYAIFIFGSKRYWPIIKSVFFIDKDDILWVKAKILSLTSQKKDLPPQGFFNGGQKLFAISVYLFTPIIMITGFIMAFQLLPPVYIRFSILVHFLSVSAILIGLPVHIFMAGFYAPEREDFMAMLRGSISEWFVFKHNYKFWKTVKMHQFQRSANYIKKHIVKTQPLPNQDQEELPKSS